jgi:hypothetical protein
MNECELWFERIEEEEEEERDRFGPEKLQTGSENGCVK